MSDPANHQRAADLTVDQLEQLMEKTMKKTLLGAGFDLEDPLGLQADAQFLRKVRNAHERVGMKILLTTIGLMVTGFAAMIVVGARHFLTKGGA